MHELQSTPNNIVMEKIIEFAAENIFWVSLWFAILLLLFWNLFSNFMLGINRIEPMEMTRMMNHEKAIVVDIRTASEFENGHILDSISIPESEFQDKKKILEKHIKKPLIVYCENGSASAKIGRQLKVGGFNQIHTLKGGLITWKNANLPLSRYAG